MINFKLLIINKIRRYSRGYSGWAEWGKRGGGELFLTFVAKQSRE